MSPVRTTIKNRVIHRATSKPTTAVRLEKTASSSEKEDWGSLYPNPNAIVTVHRQKILECARQYDADVQESQDGSTLTVAFPIEWAGEKDEGPAVMFLRKRENSDVYVLDSVRFLRVCETFGRPTYSGVMDIVDAAKKLDGRLLHLQGFLLRVCGLMVNRGRYNLLIKSCKGRRFRYGISTKKDCQ